MAKMLRQIDDEALERPFNKAQFIRLLKYMVPYKKNVIIALMLMTIATLRSLGSTMLLSRAVDALDKGAEAKVQWPRCIKHNRHGGAGSRWAHCVRATGYALWIPRAARRWLRCARICSITYRVSFSFFDSRSPGKILVRVINDVNSLNDLFTNGIVNVLIDCFTLVLLLIIMLCVNWQLTLLALCIIPVLFLIIFKIKREMRKRWQITRMKTLQHARLPA